MVDRKYWTSFFRWTLFSLLIISTNMSEAKAQNHNYQESLDRIDVLINQDLNLALAYTRSVITEFPIDVSIGFREEIMLKQAQILKELGQPIQSDSLLKLLSNLSVKNSSKEHRAHLFIIKAEALSRVGNYTEAILLTNKSALIYTELDDYQGLYNVNRQYEQIYSSLGNKKKALDYIDQSLDYVKELNCKQKFTLLFDKIALLGESGKVKEQYTVLKGLASICKKENLNMFEGELNLAWANYFLSEQNYKLAHRYFNEAENAFKAKEDHRNLYAVYLNKTRVLLLDNDFAQRFYLMKALEQAKKLGDVYLLFEVKHKLASLFFQQHSIDSAMYYANFIINNSPFLNQKIAAYEILNPILLMQNRFKEGLESMEKREALYDSMNAYKYNNALASSQNDLTNPAFGYNKTEIENEIVFHELERKNHTLILRLIGFGFILSVLFGLGFYYLLKSQNEKRNSLLSRKLIYLQLNTHFVFNSLTAIQCLILKNNVINAEHYLQLFSDLMQNFIKLSTRTKIPLYEELNFQQSYLELQKLRFVDDLKYEITVSEDIDQQQYNVPPFLIYPYLEYAIETCIQKNGARGIIGIRLKKIDDNLLMVLEDKGIGFLKLEEAFLKRPHLGEVSLYDLTKNRLREHNSWYKKNFQMQLRAVKYDNDQEICVLEFKIKII